MFGDFCLYHNIIDETMLKTLLPFVQSTDWCCYYLWAEVQLNTMKGPNSRIQCKEKVPELRPSDSENHPSNWRPLPLKATFWECSIDPFKNAQSDCSGAWGGQMEIPRDQRWRMGGYFGSRTCLQEVVVWRSQPTSRGAGSYRDRWGARGSIPAVSYFL